MSFAFTFGSFGDIVTVLQLAWQLREALDEATGTRAELRALAADVDIFVNALHDIQKFVESHRRKLRPDIMNGIGAALRRCRDTLRAMNHRIKRAEAQYAGLAWQKHLGSIAWCILGSKTEVERLRRTLTDQVNVIQLYLGLSQAQNQDAIGSQLDGHGAKLDRICGVLQDIQIRFDVGVPSFLFCDNGAYFQPLARTSLQRLLEVWKELANFDVKDFMKKLWWGLPWEKCLERIQNKRPLDIRYRGIKMSCLFFKEAAFGQWQVLIGTRPQASDFDLVLKFLLERRHAFGETCNCEGDTAGCKARQQTSVQRREDAAQTYAEAVELYFKTSHQLTPEMEARDVYLDIENIISEGPDPDFLRSVWIPKLQTAQSPDDISPLLHSAAASGLGSVPSPPDGGEWLEQMVAKFLPKFFPNGKPRSENDIFSRYCGM